MEITLRRKEPGNLFPTDILHQTSYWSSVKSSLGWDRHAFDFSLGKTKGDLLVLTRKISSTLSIAYVPQGPEILPDGFEESGRGVFLESLSDALKRELPGGCIFIRYDLPWETPYANDPDRYDSNGTWAGCPDPELREMRMNIGSRSWNVKKAPTDIQPPDTVIIDLKKPADSILERMKSKTRYNIRLSGKKGVSVYEAGREKLPDWYSLYCKTARRRNFKCHSIDYFNALFPKDLKKPETSVHLLMACSSGRDLAGIIMSVSGKRATYLYGASSDEMRGSMAPYALQWNALCLAKEKGCTGYDMYGISPGNDTHHPLYGLYRFKTGFGGDILHRQGCWDYPLMKNEYQSYSSRETLSQAFHL